MKKEKGFTIVELLVSFTLLTVVLIYLIKATTNMMTKENEILALQEYNVFESTLLNNIYDDTDGLTDLTVTQENGELNISVGNSKTIYKNISFVNNDTEKGIYYDNILYELPENVKFNPKNNSVLYTLESGNYDDENSFVKNYSIIKIPLIDNGNEKEINIVFQNADQYKLIEGTILEKAQILVYSNGICKNDGTTYNYMGGCYIKGANLNNYVWYNGFLWRIMGINGDNTVRLIMNENATTIPFSAENKAREYSASEGYVKDWLNNYFYNKLNSTRNIINYGNYFCNDVLSDVQQARNSCTNKISNYIGTISIDEYLLAGSSNSYLNINQNSWTMTPASNSNVWGLYFKSSEHEVYSFNSTNAVGVRPVINVSSTSKITSGSGTSDDNYTLVEDKSTDKKDSTIDTASTGEYVKLNDNNYRIVSKDKDGVKLILDGYSSGSLSYGDSNKFDESSGIGESLNNTILKELNLYNSNLLVTTDWYQGEVIDSGFSYNDSLKETNSAKAKVGLIRLGEVLANNPSSSQAKVHWTLNVGKTNPCRIGTSGSAGNGQPGSFYVRPVIKINNNSKISSGTGIPNNPYIIDDIKVVCKRATTLHTEECAWTDGTYYCSGAGYTLSGSKGTTTITYGNKGTKGILSSGDAFDCDVNGDGKYDSNTERFYYVNDYFNTSTKRFENDTAVLIYYNNVSGGETNNSKTYAYDSIDENWYGPVTAVKQLPKTDQWPNVSLKNTSRSILNETGTNITTGGTLPSSFSYVGYSARFLTTQELEKACNVTVGDSITGKLDNCNYLLENIKYSSNSLGSYGYWLETPIASQSIQVWHVRGDSRNVNYSSTSADGGAGVRPVIEVPKFNMSY